MLALGAGILGLFCLGGVGVFVSLYDEATEIKRSAPDAVVDNFLGAYLTSRNDADASLYTCGAEANLSALTSLRTEMLNREQKFGTSVAATWADMEVAGTANTRKSVAVELTIAGWSDGQQVSSRKELWSFDVVDRNGWRVCGAAKQA
ncbi:hypothetical protein LDL48_23770 [Wangella sp. NEAU-J3]|nr:hypothetical protein [Jidongwangia harbinensis]